MQVDLEQVSKGLQTALSIADAVTGNDSVLRMRLDRLRTSIDAAVPGVLPKGILRAELARLIELSARFVATGQEEDLTNAVNIARDVTKDRND